MLESFYIQTYSEKVELDWKLKHALGSELYKKDPLRTLRPELIGDRNRLDLMWMNKKLGIRGAQKANNDFDFLHITSPETAHPEICVMMEILENDPLPMEMAQIRFRVSSSKEKGIWIDCANTLIRDLLAEKHWLKRRLSDGWVVEMGQKHKAVFDGEDELKFAEAPRLPWLDSYNQFNEALPLKSYVSSFSQPGPEANRALMAAIFDLLDHHGVQFNSWCEYGAGYGNLTAAIASLGHKKAHSSELDPSAAALLKENAVEFFPFVETSQEAALYLKGDWDLVLIDPPRSGFPELLKNMLDIDNKPKYFVAVHCHSKGLRHDLPILRQASYSLLDWSSADIFPGTSYQEHISLWTR